MPNRSAMRINSFDADAPLQLTQLEMPAPGDEDLLVRVHAASINPVDGKIRAGKYPAVKQDMLPYILGRDIAGTVEKVGKKISTYKVGDAIFAVLGIERGAYTDHTLVRVSEVSLKPPSLSFLESAAIPLAGLTAWQGLFRHGNLQVNQTVLIHGGAGGVGHFAIQFAKAAGARVITTVSEKHADFVRSLGADQVIDYKKQQFDKIVHDVDLVFDLIAGETQDRSWAVLKRGGILVSTLTEPSPEKAQAFHVHAKRYTVTESGQDLQQIAQLVNAGKVQPKVTRIFPFAEAATALDHVKSGHMEGKVVLEMAA